MDQLLAQENVGAATPTLWVLTDHLGSTRDVATSAGAVVAHYQYDSFGVILDGRENITRYQYTGREHDSNTDYNYHRARWYDPVSGKWMSEDPIGFAAGDANVTRYVGNGVLNGVDPSGEVVEGPFYDDSYGYFHIYLEGSWIPFFSRNPELIATVRFNCRGRKSAVPIDNWIGEMEVAERVARVIDIKYGLDDLAENIGNTAKGAELAIRIANTPLDQFMSAAEFLKEPSLKAAIAMIPFAVAGAFGKFPAKPALGEAKALMKRWDAATYPSLAKSVRDHARRHGFGDDVWKYMRKAANFNKGGVTPRRIFVYGVLDRTVWERAGGEYLMERAGKIISYGFN